MYDARHAGLVLTGCTHEQFVLPWVLHCACASPASPPKRKSPCIRHCIGGRHGTDSISNITPPKPQIWSMAWSLQHPASPRTNAATWMAFEVNIIDGVGNNSIARWFRRHSNATFTWRLIPIPPYGNGPRVDRHRHPAVLRHGSSRCDSCVCPNEIESRRWLVGGCNLQRNIHLLEEAGFEITDDTKDTCLEPHVLQDITTGARQRN